METTTKHIIGGAVLLTWLVLMVIVFWWFQMRNIDSYDVYWASFEGSHRFNQSIPNNSQQPIVMHFIDPDCPCSRFSKAHIKRLEDTFSNSVSFLHSPNSHENVNQAADYNGFNQLTVPATPAVAIWDKHGELAYFGPYSGGVVCGQGVDFVSKTLEKLEHNDNPKWINHEAVGCFCPTKIS